MRFRPCIDIHNGKVKQIVGSSLKDEGGEAANNFVSDKNVDSYARLYKERGLSGGHVIILTPRGSEHMKSTAERLVAAENAFFTRWTAEEREQFTALYRRFAQDLAAEVEKI